MWKTLAPMAVGLSLFLAGSTPGAEGAEPGKNADGLVARTAVLKGVLRHVKGEMEKDPPLPYDYWELDAGWRTYYLDLRGKELLEAAERLVGRRVVATGVPERASPTLRVLSLRADDFVKETIQVEARGRLEGVRERLLIPEPGTYPAEEAKRGPQENLQKAARIVGWRFYLGEKSYGLDFGGRRELLDLARSLDGKGVFLTGTRVGDTIHVATMKADAGAYQETVAVEIQGLLERVLLEGEVRPLAEPSSDWIKHLVMWQITADGKIYTLDFSRDPELLKRALRLVNKTVVLTGTLKDGVVTVAGLRSADSRNPSPVIDGVWESTYGPVTLKYGPGTGAQPMAITGSWVQGPKMVGVITSGSFDPVKGVLEFAFSEPWAGQTGTAVLRLSADGKTLSGTWQYDGGCGGGSWTMTRR
jgi:hypothetical protein